MSDMPLLPLNPVQADSSWQPGSVPVRVRADFTSASNYDKHQDTTAADYAAFHRAYNVWLFVIVTLVDAVIRTPPFAFVHQPANTNPSRVGVGKPTYFLPYVTVILEGDTVPDRGFNFTENCFAVQRAYNVTFFADATVVVDVT